MLSVEPKRLGGGERFVHHEVVLQSGKFKLGGWAA